MVSVCTVPARGGRSCEHFGGYKIINRIPLPLYVYVHMHMCVHYVCVCMFCVLHDLIGYSFRLIWMLQDFMG